MTLKHGLGLLRCPTEKNLQCPALRTSKKLNLGLGRSASGRTGRTGVRRGAERDGLGRALGCACFECRTQDRGTIRSARRLVYVVVSHVRQGCKNCCGHWVVHVVHRQGVRFKCGQWVACSDVVKHDYTPGQFSPTEH